MKRLAALTIESEIFDVETDKIKNVSKYKVFPKNKTTLIKKIDNCQPFIGISILFLLVSLIFGGIIIIFI